MKVFVVLSALVVACVAKPHLSPLVYSAAPAVYSVPAAVPVVTSSQYHAQDTLGQYNYGYSSGISAAAESRSLDGVTRGGYSYVDANGKLQTVEYTADAAHGFQVKATNLPEAPAAIEAAPLEAPKPVEDTPEVAEAKSAHFAAVEDAKKRNEAAAAVEVAVAPVVHHPLAYSYPVAAPVAVRYAAPAVNAFSYSVHNAHPTWAHYGYAAPWW